MLLELIDVMKIYRVGDQEIRALNGVSLSIGAGEYISIMGPSGSGKSTLLHVMSLLDAPSSGQIIFKSERVETYTETQLAKLRNQEIGFVFQQFNLLPRVSAVENVSLPLLYGNIPKQERILRAVKMLERVGLGDRLENQRSQLSGGQQQRVAIARALVNEPSILFADEPTGNLDSKSGEEVMLMLDQLHHEGKTIVLVTHEPDIAKRAKRQVVVRDGKILSDSAHHTRGARTSGG